MNHDSIAVLLNPNARRVSAKALSRVSELVDPKHVYVTASERDADDVASRILNSEYTTVFAGGGDGTVTRLFNKLPADHAPHVGILRLGTGNAMAEIVSSGNPYADLRTFVENPHSQHYSLPLCEAEGTRFAFAGLGVDAAVLNDYHLLHGRLGRGGRPLRNVAGYMVAGFGITAPRLLARWLRRMQTQVRVTNLGRPAQVLATGLGGGSVTKTIKTGDVLYEGPFRQVAFGTCPYYGYGLRALPFAGIDPGRFHLRVSNVSSARMAFSLRKVWSGEIQHPKLHDFLAEQVRLEFSDDVPYQLAGEAMGSRRELTVGLSGQAVDLVRFN